MSGRWLRDRPACSSAMLALFDDGATVTAALRFEAALARAQAVCGLVPVSAALAIEHACASLAIDPATLAEEAALAGTLTIPLVARLRAALAHDAAAAAAVHRGATSQDVADSVLALQMRAALEHLLPRVHGLVEALAAHAEAEIATAAVGRTLLQDALPIGLGLRFAQWMAGLASARDRLVAEGARACALQLGGAVGTRAGMDGQGAAVAAQLAAALGLADPPAPWHARRDAVVGLAAALGILIGALGKLARDLALLAQSALGEVREPSIAGRGGSSAMAHKRNPTGCQVALSAALRAPGLVATLLVGMPQELERGLGGWQAEAPVIADLFCLADGALDAMLPVAQAPEIDRAALAAQLGTLGQGEDIGESVALTRALIAALGRRA